MELAASLASLCTRSGALAVAICTGVSGSSVWWGSDSSRVSAELAAPLVPVCAASEELTAASCTDGVSSASICEASGNAASAITVTAAAADTATVISVARSLIGAAQVFLMSAKPKPATAAMTPPTKMTVPHNATAIIANRRRVITRSPLYCRLGPCYSQASESADHSDQKMIAQGRELQPTIFPEMCCRTATHAWEQVIPCIPRRYQAFGSFSLSRLRLIRLFGVLRNFGVARMRVDR